MTTGFFSRAGASTRTNLLSSKTIRTPVSLPTDVADAKRSVSTDNARPGQTGPLIGVAARDRRRLGTAIGGLAAIFLVLTIAGVAARHIHMTPVPATTAPSAGVATTPTANATDVARLVVATTATASASSAVHGQLANLGRFPTPLQISTVTVPYADTLQLYETVLTGTTAPASATGSIRALDAQLRTDITTFAAAGAVGSNHVGQFLNSFTIRVLALQSDMTKLQQSLHPARTARH